MKHFRYLVSKSYNNLCVSVCMKDARLTPEAVRCCHSGDCGQEDSDTCTNYTQPSVTRSKIGNFSLEIYLILS